MAAAAAAALNLHLPFPSSSHVHHHHFLLHFSLPRHRSSPRHLLPFRLLPSPLVAVTIPSQVEALEDDDFFLDESEDSDVESEEQGLDSEADRGTESEQQGSDSKVDRMPTPPLVRSSSRPPKLSLKEKKELVSYAHSLGKYLKIQQVGKSGITPSLAAAFVENLESNELLKIKVHGNCPTEFIDAVRQLEEATGSVAINQIGRCIILYRPSITRMKKKQEQEARAKRVWRPQRKVEQAAGPGEVWKPRRKVGQAAGPGEVWKPRRKVVQAAGAREPWKPRRKVEQEAGAREPWKPRSYKAKLAGAGTVWKAKQPRTLASSGMHNGRTRRSTGSFRGRGS